MKLLKAVALLTLLAGSTAFSNESFEDGFTSSPAVSRDEPEYRYHCSISVDCGNGREIDCSAWHTHRQVYCERGSNWVRCTAGSNVSSRVCSSIQ